MTPYLRGSAARQRTSWPASSVSTCHASPSVCLARLRPLPVTAMKLETLMAYLLDWLLCSARSPACSDIVALSMRWIARDAHKDQAEITQLGDDPIQRSLI